MDAAGTLIILPIISDFQHSIGRSPAASIEKHHGMRAHSIPATNSARSARRMKGAVLGLLAFSAGGCTFGERKFSRSAQFGWLHFSMGRRRMIARGSTWAPVRVVHPYNALCETLLERRLWLDRALRCVVVTPHLHKVHHSVVRAEADSNFSSLFSWWDRPLRTFRLSPDPRRIMFGVDDDR